MKIVIHKCDIGGSQTHGNQTRDQGRRPVVIETIVEMYVYGLCIKYRLQTIDCTLHNMDCRLETTEQIASSIHIQSIEYRI